MKDWGVSCEWQEILHPVGDLVNQLMNEHQAADFPERGLILRAFTRPPSSFKAVIVGQDPYPTPGNAQGLAFSVAADIKRIPASLRNIFAEYQSDLRYAPPMSGDLTPWFDAGVLLLNRVLTVSPLSPGSHRGRGWECVTECALSGLVKVNPHVVAILWGKDAIALSPLFGHVITSPHPSPLSARRGFFGSRPFTRANQMRRDLGESEIEWRLP